MEVPGTHYTGGWVGPRAGLEAVEKTLLALPAIEPQLLGSPARSLAVIPTEMSRFHYINIQGDSKLLPGFPSPIIFKQEITN
jgi:hypothetical protein